MMPQRGKKVQRQNPMPTAYQIRRRLEHVAGKSIIEIQEDSPSLQGTSAITRPRPVPHRAVPGQSNSDRCAAAEPRWKPEGGSTIDSKNSSCGEMIRKHRDHLGIR